MAAEDFFFKGNKSMLEIKLNRVFFLNIFASLHTHLVHDVQRGRFLRLKALSSAS